MTRFSDHILNCRALGSTSAAQVGSLAVDQKNGFILRLIKPGPSLTN